MFYSICVLIIGLVLAIDETQSVIADKDKFELLKPSTTASLPDERRSVNFKEINDNTPKKREQHDDDSEKNQELRQEKKIRTLPGPITENGDNHHCCGSRYEPSSSGRQDSHQGGGSGPKSSSSDDSRYPSRYGSRPEDRYGWQSYTPGTPGRHGNAGSSGGSGGSGGLYGSHSGGDRYGGSRPSYYGGENDYNRPSNGNRPGRPGYGGYGGGNNGYGDNGAYGSNGYEISRPGGYGGGNRPPGGIHFGGSRPGSGSYGGGGHGGGGGGGGGGHGIFGTIDEEEEFPGQGDGGEEGPSSHNPGVNNLQTQKAVALKALAGVALIGAAAALATNPVLLPIGVLAGRKKRSLDPLTWIEDIDAQDLLKILEELAPKIYGKKLRKEAFNSPNCIARLACEIQREYIDKEKKIDSSSENENELYKSLRKRFSNLIQNKVLRTDIHYKNIEQLIKTAEAYDGNCNIFTCEFIKN